MNEHKIPTTFSSLNNDVIPDEKFLESIEKYNPKLSDEIIKEICQEKGLISSDQRVYKIISIVAQEFLEDILFRSIYASVTLDGTISFSCSNLFVTSK